MPKPRASSPSPKRRTITADLVRAALHCIPPDVDRDTWARLGL